MARGPVRRPYERVKMDVCNQSARSSAISAIVLHDTESHDIPGTGDLKAIGAWFDNPAAQASAHGGHGPYGRWTIQGRIAVPLPPRWILRRPFVRWRT